MSHDLAQNSMMMAWRSEQMGSLVSCQSTLWAMASTAFPRCLPKGGHAVRQCAGCGLLQSTISTLLVTLVMLKSRGRRYGSGNVDECHIYHNIPHDQVHGMYSDWYTRDSRISIPKCNGGNAKTRELIRKAGRVAKERGFCSVLEPKYFFSPSS